MYMREIIWNNLNPNYNICFFRKYVCDILCLIYNTADGLYGVRL